MLQRLPFSSACQSPSPTVSIACQSPAPTVSIACQSQPSDYKTLHGLENWINGRQKNYISLQGEQCILCHLDLSSKNMLWLEGGTVCLLDWASAGYYPRYFELVAQLKKGRPDKFVAELLETRAKSFTDDEIRQAKCLVQASNNAQRSAQPKPEYEPPSHSKRYIPGPPIPVAPV
jgi:thiamine kinase-like enzyme